MFFYKGLSCPHCGRAFEETDDIVACPVCGAPHHRDCWNEVGGCSCAEAHGTDEQWSREKATATVEEQPAFDPMTQPYSPTQEPFSPPPIQEQPERTYNEYAPFHMPSPFGGVDPNKEIEGESAGDLAAVVHNNTAYYLPRFEKMHNTGKHVSWNWAAFLIPTYWLLYRKQYLAGSIMLVFEALLTVSSTLLSTWYLDPLLDVMYSANSAQSYDALMAMMSATPMYAFAMVLAMMLGLFGTRLYMTHCLNRIKKAKDAYPEGYQAQLSMMGGTTFALCITAYLALTFVSNLICYFIF